MKVTFPAMKGTIGQRTYYSTMMKLNVIPKMFTFRDWIEFTPEDREQRVLNKKRIPTIAKYIVENEDGYLFSAITASYKCSVEFKPINGDEVGVLEMEFGDANFVINDGQHRCAAIAHAVKENPALGEESLSVLLFPYESRARVQQMFSDLNRFVTKTSKSLDILYDKRDELSKVTLEMCEQVDVFNGTVDKDAVSLPVRSPKLFSLAAIYDANKELLKPVTERHHSHDEMVKVAIAYWSAVAKHMPDWLKVKRGDLKSVELRQENISSHTIVLRALGAVGASLMTEAPRNWQARLFGLTSINWSKSNPDWENICIVANSVVSNRQARLATQAYVKRHLGVVLSSSESRSLPTPEDLQAVAVAMPTPEDLQAVAVAMPTPEDLQAVAGAMPTPEDLQAVAVAMPTPEDLQAVAVAMPTPEDLQAVAVAMPTPEDLQAVAGAMPTPEDLQAVAGAMPTPEDLRKITESLPKV